MLRDSTISLLKQNLYKSSFTFNRLLAIISRLSRTLSGEYLCQLKDPTGSISATLTVDVLEAEPCLDCGCVVLLKNVAVLRMPGSDGPILHLCIDASSLIQVIPQSIDHSNSNINSGGNRLPLPPPPSSLPLKLPAAAELVPMHHKYISAATVSFGHTRRQHEMDHIVKPVLQTKLQQQEPGIEKEVIVVPSPSPPLHESGGKVEEVDLYGLETDADGLDALLDGMDEF
jgi:hypothetical protein